MEPRRLLQLGYDAGYLLDDEYRKLVSLSDRELKRQIRAGQRVWIKSTGERGVYAFQELSPDQVKGIENKWAKKLPDEIKNSDLRNKIKTRLDTTRQAVKAGRISPEVFDEATKIYRDTFQAKSLAELEAASEILEDSRFGGTRRPYTVEYAREYNIDVNDRLYNSNTPEGNAYRKEVGEKIKTAKNNAYAAAKRGESPSSLKRQIELLAQSKESYTREFAKNSYRHWLNKNPNAIIKDATTWWALQPDHAKQRWYDLGGDIQKQNNEVVRKYMGTSDELMRVGQKAPKSALLQWHHLLPKEFGGVHTPENIIGVMGDAFTKEGGRHARLHDVKFRPFYSAAQESGTKALSFAPDITDNRALSEVKRLGMSLMNLKQGGFARPGLLGAIAGGGTALAGLGGLLSTEEGREKAMETLGLLGVPQEKMFELIYNLQGQGGWKGDRRIDAGDIVQNAMGQDWMAKHPNLYAGISTASDLILDPINIVGGGLLKAGASGLRKLRNIWGN